MSSEPVRTEGESRQRLLAAGLSALFGMLRLLPNYLGVFNASPVAGMFSFSGSRLRFWPALALSFVVLAFTDLILWGARFNFDQQYAPYADVTRPFVYGSFLFNLLVGRFLVRKISPIRVGAASLLGSVQFYLITNFPCWLAFGYSPDLSGLLECYAAGLPFFRNTLLSDLVFTCSVFGIYVLVCRLAIHPELKARAAVEQAGNS